jgi:hypothetical protein
MKWKVIHEKGNGAGASIWDDSDDLIEIDLTDSQAENIVKLHNKDLVGKHKQKKKGKHMT